MALQRLATKLQGAQAELAITKAELQKAQTSMKAPRTDRRQLTKARVITGRDILTARHARLENDGADSQTRRCGRGRGRGRWRGRDEGRSHGGAGRGSKSTEKRPANTTPSSPISKRTIYYRTSRHEEDAVRADESEVERQIMAMEEDSAEYPAASGGSDDRSLSEGEGSEKSIESMLSDISEYERQVSELGRALDIDVEDTADFYFTRKDRHHLRLRQQGQHGMEVSTVGKARQGDEVWTDESKIRNHVISLALGVLLILVCGDCEAQAEIYHM